ncbi:hypothetical protein Q7C36_006135 [Tachysurus vachellii]|uniref:Uncharacterized protein n=1 Tax=Tachysurus vachellii TaxID=175792 RepID=A0AA88NG68_TACVA|nr:hypothetical protein Q7C36_006135 [Tachysurus vachellii]
MTADDDVEAFLLMFECTEHREGWRRAEWANILAPLLTGEAQLAYHALEEDDLPDCNYVRQKTLWPQHHSCSVKQLNSEDPEGLIS